MGFRHPHVVVKDIIMYPVDCFQNCSQLVDYEVMHMSLSVTDDGFGVDPHACGKSCTDPVLLSSPSSQPPILSITAMA